MDSFTEDIWTIILARLPLQNITACKLVCKQWKSMVESPFLRELFLSHHQNSQSSWSLMLCQDKRRELVAHYSCKIWGLPRSLGYYVSSFVNEYFNTEPNFCPGKQRVKVLAYTDVGLILIYVTSTVKNQNRNYYVANPVSRQCVKIPPCPKSYERFLKTGLFSHAGLVTRTENDIVLGYKVVLIQPGETNIANIISLIIYTSETGLWTSKHIQYSPPSPRGEFTDPICLNGALHWLGTNLDHQDVLVSIDLYSSVFDYQYRVIHFPDSEKQPRFTRSCTTSQGYLIYMNVVSQVKDDGSMEHKLSVWRLKTGEWQLVSEISPGFIENGIDYLPMMMNPFDGNTMYMWSEMYDSLVSLNLSNGNSMVHNVLDRTRNGQTLSSVGCQRELDIMNFLADSKFSTFVLPRWLYPIPTPTAQ